MSSPRAFRLCASVIFIWILSTTYPKAEGSGYLQVDNMEDDPIEVPADYNPKESANNGGEEGYEEAPDNSGGEEGNTDGGEEGDNNGGEEGNTDDEAREEVQSTGHEGNNYGEHEKTNFGGREEEETVDDHSTDVPAIFKSEESYNIGGGLSVKNGGDERIEPLTPPVDEIGKQILDTEINDVEESYFCPCDKAVHDTLNITRKKMMRMTQENVYNIPAGIDDISATNINGRINNDNIEPFAIYKDIKSNCYAKLNQTVKSNTIIIQEISIPGRKPFKVRCEPHTRPECAYTVVMERKTKLDNFDLNWQNYREGFGDAETGGAFFVGLDNLYALTQAERRAIKFETHFEGEKLEGELYNNFVISSDQSGYEIVNLDVITNNTMVRRLRLGSKFTTKESDHGTGLSMCAQQLEMGWWFSVLCKHSSLMNSIHAYVKSPFIMAIRPSYCSLGQL